jgi:hypothetical protein
MNTHLFRIAIILLVAFSLYQAATINRLRAEVASGQQFQSQALGLVARAAHQHMTDLELLEHQGRAVHAALLEFRRRDGARR